MKYFSEFIQKVIYSLLPINSSFKALAPTIFADKGKNKGP